MKRSSSYTVLFVGFLIIILLNIIVLSHQRVEVEEKCDKLELANDSLKVTLDTILAK